MSENTKSAGAGFDACVERIEAAYEFMLAYAAQGREREPAGAGSGPSIRAFLGEMETGLEQIGKGAQDQVAGLDLSAEARQALMVFCEQLQQDATRALNVLRVVTSAPALSSQLIDNLNASAHLRCLLTDLFVLDEALRQHARVRVPD